MEKTISNPFVTRMLRENCESEVVAGLVLNKYEDKTGSVDGFISVFFEDEEDIKKVNEYLFKISELFNKQLVKDEVTTENNIRTAYKH